MNIRLCKILFGLVLIFNQQSSHGQIGDIKDLAGGAADLFSGCASSDISAGCDAYYCCWNGGGRFLNLLIDHHKEIMEMRFLNPTLVSFEMDANMAYSYHFSVDSNRFYNYVNYLPHLRGNIGVFSADFRYNVLTDKINGYLDTYKTWELIFMLNLVPSESIKFSLGTGIMDEQYTGKYYNEHYLLMQFGLFKNKDFLEMDARAAIDYNTSKFPYIDAQMRYKMRIIDLPHVYVYLSLGGIFQAYYLEHQIVGANAGFLLNIH